MVRAVRDRETFMAPSDTLGLGELYDADENALRTPADGNMFLRD
jgi:hypothetical protein